MSEGFNYYANKERDILANKERNMLANKAFSEFFVQMRDKMSVYEQHVVEGIIAERGTSSIAKHHSFVQIAAEDKATKEIKKFVNMCSKKLLELDPKLSETSYRGQFKQM